MFSSLFTKKHDLITEPRRRCQWQDVVYELKVSRKRRSIGFRVQSKGVTVSVPYGVDGRVLNEALAAKYDWLVRKQAQVRQQAENTFVLPDQIMDGDAWPVFGQSLPVRIDQGNAHSVTVLEDRVLLTFTARQKSQACRWRLWQQWYRQQALEFAEDRVDYWLLRMSGQLPRLPASVSVRQYRSRWGSCSSKGELKFNYLLAMAPKAVFDYVVVHELCHLRHMHHGPEYWHLVANFCPEWKQQRQWLKQNGPSLLMELST